MFLKSFLSKMDLEIIHLCAPDGSSGLTSNHRFKRQSPISYLSQGDRGKSLSLLPDLAEDLFTDKENQFLKALKVKELHRWKVLIDVVNRISNFMDSQNIPFLIGKGISIAVQAYEPQFIRHCHDIDLIVSPEDLSKSFHLLKAAGLSSEKLKISLHTHLHNQWPQGDLALLKKKAEQSIYLPLEFCLLRSLLQIELEVKNRLHHVIDVSYALNAMKASEADILPLIWPSELSAPKRIYKLPQLSRREIQVSSSLVTP